MEKILVISDEPALQRSLKHNLEPASFAVDIASEAHTALKMFRLNRPRVVILDLCMTGKVGRDLCRRLKQESPASAVIVLSASSDIQDKVAMLESGAEDYITKPFCERELLARVRAVFRRLDQPCQTAVVHFSAVIQK